jgi:hypothetical protein
LGIKITVHLFNFCHSPSHRLPSSPNDQMDYTQWTQYIIKHKETSFNTEIMYLGDLLMMRWCATHYPTCAPKKNVLWKLDLV